ncbi:hypothetical protein PSEUBRA_001423 [Kalmanozyma brasiliensis GHG001]|uniref:Dik6, novel virulence factor n=1 Tax=Kalmanozyma brasiliensis (strain GHG001) TaxID=1365824 RepID=V5EZ07_KALBG|nr:uncharacterized protein PSEUBRA_001423 [Kalmanozyma brasiliensis GHG001]EST09083.1 hypothetical protein PSEUBRA_001423 [Kalmanozyma brasiliensis GHG001]
MFDVTKPDLDAIPRPLSLLRPFEPNNMVFLHRGQTRLELINALSLSINGPMSHSVRSFLLVGEVECLITFVVVAFLLYKKQSLGKLWIITRRNSVHGTFYVANAVFVLVLGVALYLIAWNTTALVSVCYSSTLVSSFAWLWVVPLPWLPLIVCAYISIHGFAAGCSPLSPLSSMNRGTLGSRLKWYHFPVTKSPLIANASLILPCVLLSTTTIVLAAIGSHHYHSSERFAHRVLSAEVLRQLRDYYAGRSGSLTDPDVLASDELIWTARIVAAKYMEVLRFMDISLAVFAACAIALLFPVYCYGPPNVVSLVDHACSLYPDPIPISCTTCPRKVWFLFTKGKPTSEHSTTHLSLSSWKMTILAALYVFTLCSCVPLYAYIPIYVVRDQFPHRVLAGDIRNTLNGAMIALNIATITSCTFFAGFCTVATLDPVFRAAIGLNIIRRQIPIEIDVVRTQFDQSEHVTISYHKRMGNFLNPRYSRPDREKRSSLATVPSISSTMDTMSRSNTGSTTKKDKSVLMPDSPRYAVSIVVTTDVETEDAALPIHPHAANGDAKESGSSPA